mmetsp:Transcript_4693/g.6419  ORF Transcript_4693/g.6419 Transcript_4693/m.6419 type:complete len:132 (+) Transcript_4693:25-420(+)
MASSDLTVSVIMMTSNITDYVNRPCAAGHAIVKVDAGGGNVKYYGWGEDCTDQVVLDKRLWPDDPDMPQTADFYINATNDWYGSATSVTAQMTQAVFDERKERWIQGGKRNQCFGFVNAVMDQDQARTVPS